MLNERFEIQMEVVVKYIPNMKVSTLIKRVKVFFRNSKTDFFPLQYPPLNTNRLKFHFFCHPLSEWLWFNWMFFQIVSLISIDSVSNIKSIPFQNAYTYDTKTTQFMCLACIMSNLCRLIWIMDNNNFTLPSHKMEYRLPVWTGATNNMSR